MANPKLTPEQRAAVLNYVAGFHETEAARSMATRRLDEAKRELENVNTRASEHSKALLAAFKGGESRAISYRDLLVCVQPQHLNVWVEELETL